MSHTFSKIALFKIISNLSIPLSIFYRYLLYFTLGELPICKSYFHMKVPWPIHIPKLLTFWITYAILYFVAFLMLYTRLTFTIASILTTIVLGHKKKLYIRKQLQINILQWYAWIKLYVKHKKNNKKSIKETQFTTLIYTVRDSGKIS